MRQFNEDTLTDAVVSRLKKTKNPRVKARKKIAASDALA
jgi:hypothetical protein